MRRIALAALLWLLAGLPAVAEIAERPGWVVVPTKHDFAALTERVIAAAGDVQLGVVSQASASAGAKKALGKVIPGNAVIGLYHPRFAVPMLEASIAAGIEAPVRVYVTENADGTATLSYKTPSFVFAPYFEEGGEKLQALARDLDQVFATVAQKAAGD
jgi:uncharacterized protein (DUF302 family)